LAETPVLGTCYGFGPNTSGSDGSGALRFAVFEYVKYHGPPEWSLPTDPSIRFPAKAWPFWVVTKDNNDGQYHMAGDSGGPCLGAGNGILSLHWGRTPAWPFDSGGTEIAAKGFKAFADRATNAIATAQGYADGDQFVDTLLLLTNWDNTVLVTADFGNGESFSHETGIDASVFQSGVPSIVTGSFNLDVGSSLDDAVALIGGQLVYFQSLVVEDGFGNQLGTLVPMPVLSSQTFASINSSQLNADSYDDVEAATGDGDVQVFYGSPTGLSSGISMQGFPSADANDGKFITVSQNSGGTPFAITRPNPKSTLYVGVSHDSSSVTVQVFDGDLAGLYDYYFSGTDEYIPDNVVMCYALTPDKFKKDSKEALPIVIRTGEEFGDGAWTSLYEGPVHDSAQAPSGNYFYRVDAWLALDECSSDEEPPNPYEPVVPVRQQDLYYHALNAFKVRATGQVSVTSDDFGFIAYDEVGPYFQPYAHRWTPAMDTDFDGEFTFHIPVSQSVTAITLSDDDADYKFDEDRPGVGYGISELSYVVETQTGTYENTNPSGNYLGAGSWDKETHTVPVLGPDQTLVWRWDNVLAENNIHVWPPGAVTADVELFGAPAPVGAPYVASSVQPVPFWEQAGWQQILPHLPIVLGELNERGWPVGHTVVIRTVPQAKNVLRRSVNTGNSNTASIHSLFGELLAARLNLARGPELSDPLGAAHVWGESQTVAQLVWEADRALANRFNEGVGDLMDLDGHQGCPGDELHNNRPAQIRRFIRLLRSINGGSVGYSAPSSSSDPDLPTAAATPDLPTAAATHDDTSIAGSPLY